MLDSTARLRTHQEEQEVPDTATLPRGQAEQEVAPADGATVLAAQAVHEVAPPVTGSDGSGA